MTKIFPIPIFRIVNDAAQPQRITVELFLDEITELERLTCFPSTTFSAMQFRVQNSFHAI